MTAFYELMERCVYQPPDEAVEALAAELGMTAAVARTFVRKELAALAKMAQMRAAHAAMDRGRAAGALAQRRRALRLHALGHVQAQVRAFAVRAIVADANDDDDDGVEGGAGGERALPRAPMPRLTAGELRSALGVRRCEGSPLFPECVLPMRASGGASACFLCAPPRGGSGQRSASSWGDLWSLVDEVAAQGLEEAVLAGLAGAAEEGGGEDGLAGAAEEGGRDATRRLVRALLHEWPAATSQHRRVVAALGRGAWRRLRATRPASMAAASPWLAVRGVCKAYFRWEFSAHRSFGDTFRRLRELGDYAIAKT